MNKNGISHFLTLIAIIYGLGVCLENQALANAVSTDFAQQRDPWRPSDLNVMGPGETAIKIDSFESSPEAFPPYFGVGALTGTLNYPGVENLEVLNPLAGIGIRGHVGRGIHLGGEFLYSYYEMEINRVVQKDIETVDDYIFVVDFGYDLMNAFYHSERALGVIVGGVVTHHRRQYNLVENASRSFDVGVFVEASYFVTHHWLLALKWRFLQNSYFDRDQEQFSQDANIQEAAAPGRFSKLEEFDSQMLVLSLNYVFQ